MGSDGFEHYVPDMKTVVDIKNADIDTYIAGAAGMALLMKALVFGVPPEPFEVSADANSLTRNLARSPVGLRSTSKRSTGWVPTRSELKRSAGSASTRSRTTSVSPPTAESTCVPS
ncbi:MAG: hypothetical protein NVS4B6_28890 [Mycobacterium sp.]